MTDLSLEDIDFGFLCRDAREDFTNEDWRMRMFVRLMLEK
jgi:hypothetical protein